MVIPCLLYVWSLSHNYNDRSQYLLTLLNNFYLPCLEILDFFLNRGTLFVCEDIISAFLFLGCYLYGFTPINEFESLVDEFDFLNKEELSSIPCG